MDTQLKLIITLKKIKMKSIDKKILLQQIEIQPDGFNMYQFIKNYNTQ